MCLELFQLLSLLALNMQNQWNVLVSVIVGGVGKMFSLDSENTIFFEFTNIICVFTVFQNSIFLSKFPEQKLGSGEVPMYS